VLELSRAERHIAKAERLLDEADEIQAEAQRFESVQDPDSDEPSAEAQGEAARLYSVWSDLCDQAEQHRDYALRLLDKERRKAGVQ